MPSFALQPLHRTYASKDDKSNLPSDESHELHSKSGSRRLSRNDGGPQRWQQALPMAGRLESAGTARIKKYFKK